MCFSLTDLEDRLFYFTYNKYIRTRLLDGKHIVILGAGFGGLACAELIAKESFARTSNHNY